MSKYKTLNVGGALIDEKQLEIYLEKVAADQILKSNSDINTYPVPRVKENLNFIYDVYKFLSEDIKNKIPIHPAGEWIVDNFYIVEKNAKTIIRNLTLKKYKKLIGIANGTNKGFARVYVLAKEIVSYTDGKINASNLERCLLSYQRKKTLSMEELWSINLFLQIALIEKIREICEKIYLSQMQKRKVDNIIDRLVDFKSDSIFKAPKTYNLRLEENVESKYPFIEYMSYRLKRYGKRAYSYLEVLEDQIQKMGSTIADCVNKEHYDVAAKKISVGNSIMSINTLNRMNFIEIFNRTNGVEDVLNNDPIGVYPNMDYKTKEYYRAEIENIAKKYKISEIYIAKKCLELAQKNYEKIQSNESNKMENDECDEIKNEEQKNKKIESNNCSKVKNEKKSHVGYYLIDEGRQELCFNLNNKKITKDTKMKNAGNYIRYVSILSVIIGCIIAWYIQSKSENFVAALVTFFLLFIPIKEILKRSSQYFSSQVVKPKLIPKMDFYNGIPEEYTTMVIIPTILNSKSKVEDIIKKMEVYYIANKSQNIYFTLLGDCTESSSDKEIFDDEVINRGVELCNILNKKYPDDRFQKFNFLYRKRVWCEGENKYIGWERKRGLIEQFNSYLLNNTGNENYLVNTIETWKKNNEMPKIKYIITLDADTNLVLNTGLELVGAMAHILNKPELDSNNKIVCNGYSLIQPRVGINLNDANRSIFTKLFSGIAGTDSYTNAISDFYFDNFNEGIFAGKGIYDLNIFYNIMKNEIPNNTVLSHDLLEGSYARCGLASDIMLMDGYPSTYNAYRARSHRWMRGDWQIWSWIFKIKLNILSKYKILDNLSRSLNDAFIFILLIFNIFYKSNIINFFVILCVITPFFIELLNKVVHKKHGEIRQKKFSKEFNGVTSIFVRAIIDILLIPDKAFLAIDAAIKTIYRMVVTKKHLLQWTTSEDTERKSRDNIFSYVQSMIANIIAGVVFIIIGALTHGVFSFILGVGWIVAPFIMQSISRPIIKNEKVDELNEDEKKYVLDIGQKTWMYFKDNLNERTNYLPPDNYQENRKQKVAYRTSPTNIGLALLSVVSSYDLKYESKDDAINLINKIIKSVEKLPKWHGHLYNWYNIEDCTPLIPRYISSVDSGNLVGYLYVLKQFLIHEYDENIKKSNLINRIDKLIDETDFSKVFDERTGLFSIGFNIEENKMTDSYYDLLASEARQASIVAIAKKDITAKHWKNLSRTLTILNGYKGLISWSGTAFEYLMPTINIKRYENSLLDESCKFLIMSQIEYAKKLGITWGVSEAAFNIKDLEGNYQYKAFGIPWLGLKRGLDEDMVVSSYGTMLAINDVPKLVVNNIKQLEKCGMLNKYGLYESIDYTPGRVSNSKQYSVVKTYMAHHQGLILLSINNLINNNILQERFSNNPEIEAVDILLQERMPDNVIITKEEKERIEKIKYIEYSYYCERVFDKKNSEINEYNLISNNEYSVLIDKFGNGYSKYKDFFVNRYKPTDEIDEGIKFYIKDIENNNLWSPIDKSGFIEDKNYRVVFSPDKSEYIKSYNDVKTKMSVIVAPEDPVELRILNLNNMNQNVKKLEISCLLEPVISSAIQDYAHKAFNNLFLSFELIDNIILVRRRFRNPNENDMFLAISLYSKDLLLNISEFELDKNSLCGRNNFAIPKLIAESRPFSNQILNTTNSMIALRNSVELEQNKDVSINFIISLADNKDLAIKNIKKYQNDENIERAIKLSRAQTEAKIQYLGITGKDVCLYQKILSHLLNKHGKNNVDIQKDFVYKNEELWKFGISGDNPILLVTIRELGELDILKKLVKAFEYFKIQGIKIDLVVINNEPESYENYLRESINEIIWNYRTVSNYNGIYVLNNISKEDENLLMVRSNLHFVGRDGKIELQLEELDYEYKKMMNNFKLQNKKLMAYNVVQESKSDWKLDLQNLKYYNEYGGFSDDGKEYIININKNKKLPLAWSNIMCNKIFGTVVTENMGGYTWYKNSRLNRVSAWSNDSVCDVPSEIIYFYDEDAQKMWTTSLSPIEDENEYYIKYGMGYSTYMHYCNGIEQSIDVYVPSNESLKVNIIKLKNCLPKKRNIRLVYYIKNVLDEDEMKSSGYVDLNYNKDENYIEAKNIVNSIFNQVMYVSSSEKIKSYTGIKKEFFGSGGISNPDGVKISRFSGSNSLNNEGIIAINIDVSINALEQKEISLFFGVEENTSTIIIDEESSLNINEKVKKYSVVENCWNELSNVKKYWTEMTEKVIIDTPIESINIISNGWIIYQVLCSRLYGRSGYYQSGGALGFRDQLQDVLCLKYFDVDIMRNQILKHCEHQFIEGDVLHWWHEDNKRGIRTRFSDDLLWLPFVVSDYIEYTNDINFLDYEVPYLVGEMLPENVDERYDKYEQSVEKGSVYEHCIKAIEKSLNFGEHGIPKIGSGDWNDGFSNVGNKGDGESVWLGFFLYDILNKFLKFISLKSDTEREQKYSKIIAELKNSLNNNCWDGMWFCRAFCDDGAILGSAHNQECRIDSIAQSWAVISNAGQKEKNVVALDSLDKYLIDRKNGIIKLLDPPFENSNLNPGYIKSYLPGTRENGGQYTHAAIWAIIANAIIGDGTKAVDLYKMINPIEHSKTYDLVNKYKIEPFVIPADIYGYGNLQGQGGWSWYTGSASWYYICLIKYILGIKIEENQLLINPNIPQDWNGYKLRIKHQNKVFNINVISEKSGNLEVKKMINNGIEVADKKININECDTFNQIEILL